MRITKKIGISTTSDVIWAYLVESEKFKKWNPDVVEEKSLDDRGVAVGSRGVISMKEGGKIQDYESELIEVAENKRLKISLRGKPLGQSPMFVEYNLMESNGATELEYVVNWAPKEFSLKLLSPVINMMAKKNAINCLGKLKSCSEGHR